MNVVSDLDDGGRQDDEIVRLRDELTGLQQRLDEERSFYRARLESQRQEFEREQVRDQAEEVARRRRAEERVSDLLDELAVARAETARARRSYSELEARLLEVERSSEAQARSEVEQVIAEAKSSWRFAEEELSRSEEELRRARSLLARERERNLRLTELVKNLRSKQLETRDRTSPAPSLAPPQVAASAEQWTYRKIAEIDDQLSDEFLLLEADHSFKPRPQTSEPVADEPEGGLERAKAPAPLPAAAPVDKARFDVSDTPVRPAGAVAATASKKSPQRSRKRRHRWAAYAAVIMGGVVALYWYTPLSTELPEKLLEIEWRGWAAPDASVAPSEGGDFGSDVLESPPAAAP